jgi:serine/threonine protein kinase
VEYLHTGWHLPVIHRDVKSSNVVLSTTYDAKLTDFGLTKLRDQAGDSVTTQVKGTVGYLDPE